MKRVENHELTEWTFVPFLVNASNRFSPSCMKEYTLWDALTKEKANKLKNDMYHPKQDKNLFIEILFKLFPWVVNFNNHISKE